MSRKALFKTMVSGAVTAVLLGTSSVPALAMAPDDAPTRVVHFGDLDLSHRAGAAALYARIRSAAAEVCTSPGGAEFAAILKTCKEQAIARAVAQVNAPLLWSYHFERNKQSIAQHS